MNFDYLWIGYKNSPKMSSKIVIVLILVAVTVFGGHSLELKARAYEDLVISVSDAVPAQNCKNILANLEVTLTSASQYLFAALNSRAYFRSATVLLPQSWPDSCVPSSSRLVSSSGETPDVTVLPKSSTRGSLWTQQSLGCGQPGDQIYLGYETLRQKDQSLGRLLVKEFAKYRYGVFDEQGYSNDPIYPLCYYDDQTKEAKQIITGCSEWPIIDNGICSGTNTDYNITKMVSDVARSSIMFAAEAPSVSLFCDEGSHNRFAPTKHNLICQHRSTFDVIKSHPDFASDHVENISHNSQITDTTPKITYKKQNITRYVLIIENTKDMLQRESWSYLRFAVRKWAVFDLPENTEIGVVLMNETGSQKVLNILSLKSSGDRFGNRNRDMVSSSIPYTPGDSSQAACLHCALKEAVHMLNERSKSNGPASQVILVIAPGTVLNSQLKNAAKEAGKAKIKIATVNYPSVMRTSSLDCLAEETDGQSFTVAEKRLNIETSLLSTYFHLSNVLYSVVQKYYAGNPADLPMEIHRREIKDDGRSSVTGSFVLDSSMGEPARFMLYTHNSDSPLIRSLKLISPSQQVFATRSDNMLNFKIITVASNISETGTWSYVIEPYAGNPQPHFLQVLATPRSSTAPVIRAKFWTHRAQEHSPLVLLAEVKRGEFPIMGAKVEVVVTRPETNGSVVYKDRFELLDTGSGDPDITKGDGIYTRYFSAAAGGPGVYTFEVTVTDNGNTAYSEPDLMQTNYNKPCCGSIVPSQKGQAVSPFQRILPPVTMEITSEDIVQAGQTTVGCIGDLKVEVLPDMKARLSWTAPDMGGQMMARYEIKYAKTVQDIADQFETVAVPWEAGSPFVLSPGSETTFTLNFSQEKNLLDRALYFAIKAFGHDYNMQSGTVSNWVRVLVPSPPPPPTIPPTYPSNEQSSWPFSNPGGADQTNPSVSKSATFGLELILPVAIGFLLLVVLLIAYCYFCVVKRKKHPSHKKSSSHGSSIKADKLNSTITIVPSSPANIPSPAYTPHEVPDPHTVGVPISNYGYEEETKKPYSLVHQQEQQLIEELKQQQHMQHQPNNYSSSGLSVISGGTLQRNGHTLSPYNSWSASQLLHEHERRHSPLQEEQLLQERQDAFMNGSQIDQMSLNGGAPNGMDHVSLNGHYAHPPPVPPLPAFTSNGYPINYNIYGVHHPVQQQQIYQSMSRNEQLVPFNQSLQGSMSSVNSGDKKRRNVTMV